MTACSDSVPALRDFFFAIMDSELQTSTVKSFTRLDKNEAGCKLDHMPGVSPAGRFLRAMPKPRCRFYRSRGLTPQTGTTQRLPRLGSYLWKYAMSCSDAWGTSYVVLGEMCGVVEE